MHTYTHVHTYIYGLVLVFHLLSDGTGYHSPRGRRSFMVMKRNFLHILLCNNMDSVNWHNSCSSMLTERRATEQILLGNQESIEFLAKES
jgi:hypothetical protein